MSSRRVRISTGVLNKIVGSITRARDDVESLVRNGVGVTKQAQKRLNALVDVLDTADEICTIIHEKDI
jgi:hypothetical protein